MPYSLEMKLPDQKNLFMKYSIEMANLIHYHSMLKKIYQMKITEVKEMQKDSLYLFETLLIVFEKKLKASHHLTLIERTQSPNSSAQ